jgi:transcriptional regulatory protein LevR
MEALLDLYNEPYDEKRPVVCFDEKPYQMVSQKKVPLPMKMGQCARHDYEYKREGTRNLFVFLEPKACWRHVVVTTQRTGLDFAEQMRYLVEDRYPQAEQIRVVLDNLNTHKLKQLYERFEPERARGIVKKLQFYYTPEHASWLNMVELELSVLGRQCLKQRIGSEEKLKQEIAAWQKVRNENGDTIRWSFTATKARKKLQRHYPSIS